MKNTKYAFHKLEKEHPTDWTMHELDHALNGKSLLSPVQLDFLLN